MAALFGSLFFVGFSSFILEMQNDFGTNYIDTSKFNGTFSNTESLQEDAEALKDVIDEGLSLTNFVSAISDSLGAVVNIVFTSLDILFSAVVELGSDIGLPITAASILLSALVIGVCLTIVSIVFRWRLI
jgi:hypothetical protein|tara:strand:+ start:550 stop:939 length:390 start_codon:yes stop_codon:yes gene_type:complete